MIVNSFHIICLCVCPMHRLYFYFLQETEVMDWGLKPWFIRLSEVNGRFSHLATSLSHVIVVKTEVRTFEITNAQNPTSGEESALLGV